MSDRRQVILARLGISAPAHTKMGIGLHTHVHGLCLCPRVTPTCAITPHLQVNISNPLEHALVGPDHGVCVLRLTSGPALLEGLVGRERVNQLGDEGAR